MSNFNIRRLGADDMAQASVVHRAAFNAALPWLADLHTPVEDHAFWREHLLVTCTIWGATEGPHLLGVIAVRPGWIEQLYVRPEAQGKGIGSALLARAREGQTILDLWTFQANAPARRFYETHGFVAVEQTDGRTNEEREPDVRYRWIVPS
ncbi:GNAT family N-acetyltransferase [Rhizobium sp. CSW-27]|nr:GNAT family N-acetyltransferase [Rhizobium sp. CSW-27]